MSETFPERVPAPFGAYDVRRAQLGTVCYHYWRGHCAQLCEPECANYYRGVRMRLERDEGFATEPEIPAGTVEVTTCVRCASRIQRRLPSVTEGREPSPWEPVGPGDRSDCVHTNVAERVLPDCQGPCDTDCEIAPEHCEYWHLPKASGPDGSADWHDPAGCDRHWRGVA